MHFDFETLAPRDCYKLLTGVVVPRPIALVTTLDENEIINAAPFSFFNVMGSDPPIVAFAPGDRAPDVPKDTARNIARQSEFVVNLVDEDLARAMNICATDFPAGIDELKMAGLTPAPSMKVRVPRIAQSPVSLECKQHSTIEIGRNRIVIGQVVQMHIRDELINLQRLYVQTENLHAIGRMHGGGGYCKTTEWFEIPRQTYEEWQREQNAKLDVLASCGD